MCPWVYRQPGVSSLKIQPVLFLSLGQVTLHGTFAIHVPVILSSVTNDCFGPGLDEAHTLAQTKLISMTQHHHFNIIATFRSIEFCCKALNMRIKSLHEDIRPIQFLSFWQSKQFEMENRVPQRTSNLKYKCDYMCVMMITKSMIKWKCTKSKNDFIQLLKEMWY